MEVISISMKNKREIRQSKDSSSGYHEGKQIHAQIIFRISCSQILQLVMNPSLFSRMWLVQYVVTQSSFGKQVDSSICYAMACFIQRGEAAWWGGGGGEGEAERKSSFFAAVHSFADCAV